MNTSWWMTFSRLSRIPLNKCSLPSKVICQNEHTVFSQYTRTFSSIHTVKNKRNVKDNNLFSNIYQQCYLNTCQKSDLLLSVKRCIHKVDVTTIRLKSRGGRKKQANKDTNEEDSDEEDSDDEDEYADDKAWARTYPEDEEFPSNCKEIKKRMKSLRGDAILSAGLGISRKKVDGLFLDSKLRLNGEKLLKIGKQVEEEDYLDVLDTGENGNAKVKRVRVVKVDRNKGPEKKMDVYIRSWRALIETDQYSK